MKIKMDPTKVLSAVVSILGVAGMLLSNKVESDNRKTMKSELKEEILKELSKTTKES